MKKLLPCILCTILLGYTQAQADPSVWDKPTQNYDGNKNITVYRDPNCGCCKAWIKHLKKHDFNVTDITSGNMSAIKQQYKVPSEMASCHTAVIDGYAIEGHVPADDIIKLLITRPDIVGLSVPRMPVGTPGMEQGQRKDPFAVIKIDNSGTIESFSEYWAY